MLIVDGQAALLLLLWNPGLLLLCDTHRWIVDRGESREVKSTIKCLFYGLVLTHVVTWPGELMEETSLLKIIILRLVPESICIICPFFDGGDAESEATG